MNATANLLVETFIPLKKIIRKKEKTNKTQKDKKLMPKILNIDPEKVEMVKKFRL